MAITRRADGGGFAPVLPQHRKKFNQRSKWPARPPPYALSVAAASRNTRTNKEKNNEA